MTFGKTTIINTLSALHGFENYLEICTPTTGNEFAAIDSTLLTLKHRLMYAVPTDFDDGLPIDVRCDGFDIESRLAPLRQSYDVILVDPYHDYKSSLRDITLGYGLLRDGGCMIVHDCWPPRSGDIISPTFVPGEWCGVTFIAYIDFVLASGAAFQTVDCDYGCGIIAKKAGTADAPAIPQDILNGWATARSEPSQAFDYLRTEPEALLRLRSPNKFLTSTISEAAAAHRAEIAAMQAGLGQASAQIDRLKQQVLFATERADKAETTAAQLAPETERLSRQLNQIEHSLSWRITSPLRAVNQYVQHRGK